MEYQFIGYTLEKGIVKGRIEADTEAEARDNIIQRGYKLLQVKASWRPPGLETLFPSLFKVKSKDLVRFTQQLAIMVRGGGSLQRALELLEIESRNRVMRRILTAIVKSLNEGGSLSSAMAQHPAVFSPRFVSVVGAGEHTGRLAPALDQLASIMDKEQDARQKAKRTMMMPMFTIGASMLMLVLMLTVLLPPLLETFEKMGKDIPLITRIAMAAVGGLTNNLKLIALGIVLTGGGIWGLRRAPNFQYYFHLLQARSPILGPLILAGEISQFSRTIAMLLHSGIPLATALPLGIAGCKNLTLRRAFAAGEESLVAGHGLTEALRTFSILPKMWVELVMIGEESNTLSQTMDDLADAYQKEVENRLGSLLAMLEPLSTFMVGGIVLFIALSMFLPIYSGLDGAASQ
jgi:type II secretory pathway component PulF